MALALPGTVPLMEGAAVSPDSDVTTRITELIAEDPHDVIKLSAC